MAPKRHHNQQVATSPNHPPPTRGNNNNSNNNGIASMTTTTSSTSSSSNNNNNNLPNSPSSKSSTPVSLHQPWAKKSSTLAAQQGQDVLAGIWERYVFETPQRVKLLDTFMAFLVLVGALQFVYCVLVGNYVSLVFFALSHLTSLSLSLFFLSFFFFFLGG